MIENANVIRYQFDLGQHMGRDQDGAVVQIRQGFHQVADFMDAGRVKPVCRLIQNQDRGPAQQRTGDEARSDASIGRRSRAL